MNTIEAKDRLIVALDFSNKRDALALVESLDGVVSFFKVGLELFMAEGCELVKELRERRKKKVFLDIKMDDVEETISRAVRQVAQMEVQFLTIYGNRATAKAANSAKGNELKILQVTLLTSLSEEDLRDLFLVGQDKRFGSLEEYILWRAEMSLKCGCDGLISSGQNVGMLRKHFGSKPLIVCPGIRTDNGAVEDHKRPCTPFRAISDGADYLVVGRPVRDAPDPVEAARNIIAEIEKAQVSLDGSGL